MRESVRLELVQHVEDRKKELSPEQIAEDLHYYCFDSDYIEGTYKATEWLKYHEIEPFQALEDLQELQLQHFGEVTPLERITSETVVNQLVYFYGLEL